MLQINVATRSNIGLVSRRFLNTMYDRLTKYLKAVEEGRTEKYWDYSDVRKKKMSIKQFNRRWGTSFYEGWRRNLD